MKMLLIDVNCKNGSTGKIIYDLYSCFRANGHEASICYGRGPLVREPDIYRFAHPAEVYMHAFLSRLTGFTSCFSPFATMWLLSYIKKYKPDVVHLHDIHGYFVNVSTLLRFLKKNDIKTVCTLHCEYMYTGKCGHAYDCERWKTICGHCPEKKSYPKSVLFDFTKLMYNTKRKIYNGFDNLAIVSVSKWLDGRVGESILKDKKRTVIYNGIDTSVFHPYDTSALRKKHGLAGEKIIIHVTGNFEDQRKGGKYVLELAKRMPEVKFFIIGNNNSIEKLPKNVMAIGRTENQTQLAEYYSLGDVSLITSQRETFSMICAESLSCGTPIVGFNSGAPAEIAPDGYGMFVPYGDMDRLEDVMRDILFGDVKLHTAGECVRYGREHYDKGLMAENYFNLYLT